MECSAETIPFEQINFVAFDTETTGLSPVVAKLVELSGVKFRSDGVVLSTFSALIDPEQGIPPEATAIHGITDDMVRGQPTYRQVVPEFFAWAQADTEVVFAAHNAPFDLGFLSVALSKLSMPVPKVPVLDTLPLSRRLVPESRNHQLKTLAEHLNLDSGSYHRALADSHHVKDLLLRLISLTPEPTSWDSFVRISGTLRFTDLFQEAIEQGPETSILIRDAICSNRQVSIVYRGTRPSSRVVTPLSVHAWRGNMYMTAYCHHSCEERTFRIDRIEQFQPLDPAPQT